MDAKELRIGNITNKGIVNGIRFYEGHLGCDIIKNEYDSFSNWYSWLDLKPIPLTEEWLLKFGFELDEDLGDMIYYKLGKWVVCFDHEDLSFNHQLNSGITCLIYDNNCFQHVHQLQNLYFALTGKELTIKQLL